MALRILIAEDEEPARNKMLRLLGEFDEVEVVAVATNGLDAFNGILEHQPDVAFLDIEMPGMNGLDVVSQLPPDVFPHVVFATAYNEHAIKAFELNAMDYILKPFSKERLQQALEKAGLGDDEDRPVRREVAQKLAEELSPANLEKIPIPTADRYKLVDFDEVVCIEVEERMTNIYTINKSYPINMTLETFERKLPAERFIRISRSAIINVQAIEEVVLWFGNRYKVVLSNGKEVISSRERSKVLKKMLKF
jgi:DNA-binding LytR/AlgR family response regulator